MSARSGNSATTWLLNLPGLVWLSLLFAVPTLIVFTISFKPADVYGGTLAGWTLKSWTDLVTPAYLVILWRTLVLSVLATLISMALSVPCAYFIAREPPNRRRIWLLLVILPFWTSFLVRTLAWKVLLHPEGMLKHGLVLLGLAEPGSVLLYNQTAVLLVMVYTYLPFAILPIYAAAEKFDFSLLDAARDLGASSRQSFFQVFLPGISQGLSGAMAMVFIPTLGCYVVPDLVGGPSGEMIGNKIVQRTFVDRNLPLAAALAAALTLGVLVPMILALWRRWREREVS